MATAVVFIPSAIMGVDSTIRPNSMPDASLRPTWRLRLRSPVQVRTKSPSPAKPESVSGLASECHSQARYFSQPAGDQSGNRVVPEAEAVADSGAYRYDILERTADFHAYRIVAAVDAKGGTGKGRLDVTDERLDLRRPTRRLSDFRSATSRANVGPERAAMPKAGSEDRPNDLRHAQHGGGFQPFGGADDRAGPGCSQGRIVGIDMRRTRTRKGTAAGTTISASARRLLGANVRPSHCPAVCAMPGRKKHR